MPRGIPTPLQLCFRSHRIYFALRRYLAGEKLGDLDAFERSQRYFEDALQGEQDVKDFKRRGTFVIGTHPRQLAASKAYNRIIDLLEVMHPDKDEEQLARLITEFSDTTKALLRSESVTVERVERYLAFFKTFMDVLMANELAIPFRRPKIV